MKKIIASSLLSLTMATTASTSTLICFTANEPVNSPEFQFLGNREIYLTKNQETYTIRIASEEALTGIIPCDRTDEMSNFLTHLRCGNEDISIDYANMNGHITRQPDESGPFARQIMVCRDRDRIIQ